MVAATAARADLADAAHRLWAEKTHALAEKLGEDHLHAVLVIAGASPDTQAKTLSLIVA